VVEAEPLGEEDRRFVRGRLAEEESVVAAALGDVFGERLAEGEVRAVAEALAVLDVASSLFGTELQ